MTTVALCSVKGAPGLTTMGLALTSALTTDPSLSVGLVEADPAGGDVAPMVGLRVAPGMVSLAAASRHAGVRPDLEAHAQNLPCGGWVVVGSIDPGQASASVTTLAGRLVGALVHAADHAVIDCGRWWASSPAAAALAQADRTLVLIRPTVSGIEHLRTRIPVLSEQTGGRLGVVVVGSAPYSSAEVEAVTGLPVDALMPFDQRGKDAVRGEATAKAARRTPLVRMARSLADQLEKLDAVSPTALQQKRASSQATVQ